MNNMSAKSSRFRMIIPLSLNLFILLFFVTTFAQPNYKMSFFYQPHESAGTDCSYSESTQPHGYLVKCGNKQFRIHHFARPHLNSKQLSWEVLYWVTNLTATPKVENVGTSLWVKADLQSQLQEFKLGQSVDNDTATLDLTISLTQASFLP